MASFGSAFTGRDDETDSPTRNIVSDSAGALNRALFSDPQSRAALLQIGLGLMQPVGLGQSTMGHIGAAIGSGGEAQARAEKQDLAEAEEERKRKESEQKLDIAEQKLELARQGGGLTPYQQLRLLQSERAQERADTAEGRRAAHESRVTDQQLEFHFRDLAAKKAANLLRSDADIAKYGTDEEEIYQKLRKEYEQGQAMRSRAGGGDAAPSGGAKPRTVIQNGHTYTLQPDGSYK